MDEARFYRQSGGFPPAALLVPLVMLPIAFLLGFVYAYIDIYLPVGGYITVVITFGAGLAAGVANVYLLRVLKVRSPGLAWGLGLIAGIFTLYFAWAAFGYGILRKSGNVDVSLTFLLGNPGALWDLALIINQEGWYNVFGMTPSGALLWVFWAIEAVMLVGMPTLISGLGMSDDVFCEACNAWAEKEEEFLFLKVPEGVDPGPGLKEGDLGALLKLEPTRAGPGRTLKVDVSRCPRCDNLHTVTVESVVRSAGDDGDRIEDLDAVVTNLLITGRQYVQLQELKDSLPAEEEPSGEMGPGSEPGREEGEGESTGR